MSTAVDKKGGETLMYTCANCGVAFEGRVCPNCCTMRPAAAVLGDSGQILKSKQESGLAPGRQAARLAEDLEHSRQIDARRMEQQRHAQEMRMRAAELMAAAERQQKEAAERDRQKNRTPQQEEEELRYARQAQKAANWQRKAPMSRAVQLTEEEEEVDVTEALRQLRISISDTGKKRSSAPPLTEQAQKPVATPSPTAKAQTQVQQPTPKPAPAADTDTGAHTPSYPSGVKIPARKGDRMGRVPARSQRIDDAWRLMASQRAAADLSSADTDSQLPKHPSPPKK